MYKLILLSRKRTLFLSLTRAHEIQGDLIFILIHPIDRCHTSVSMSWNHNQEKLEKDISTLWENSNVSAILSVYSAGLIL